MQTIRTPEKEAAILEALRDRPVFAAACRKARVSKAAFFDWRRDDPEFDKRVLAAREEGLDALEDALASRGLKDDTTAAIFMLKSLRRELYGDKVDHTVAVSLTTTPEWVAFRTALLAVLDRYPQVKAEVIAEMARIGGVGEPALP
jgi:hypothetical protein